VRLIHGLKYSGWISLAPRLGELMREAARRIEKEYAVLVPVPLAPARLRERGFNQARLLAEGLGSVLGWPVRDILERRRPGAVQARSGRRKRAVNVAGAYRVRPHLLSELEPTAGSLEPPVLLVDDVITTGATIIACAASLEAADIACAGAVSFARTPPRVPGT
jgi:predicted amidophosphoribosyltransferase